MSESTTDGDATGMSDEAARITSELPGPLERDLIQLFKLLADENRLRILMFLGRQNELHVTALCGLLGQSQPAVSHHLALLRVGGLIESRRDGKHNFYSIRRSHFHDLLRALIQHLDHSETNQIRFDGFVLRQDR